MRGAAYRAARAAYRKLTRPVGTVRAVRTDAAQIVLTYDDGPDPQGTGPVLEALARFGATATFFVLTPRARQHRNLLAEIVAAGHEVGLHGIDHQRLTRFPAPEVRRRTLEGKAVLEDLLQAPVRWFRPPYGAQLPATWWAVRRAGLEPVVWGPTPADWRALPEPDLAADAMVGAAPGAIVLAHDGYAGPQDGAEDGDPPNLDRGRLTTLMLRGYQERGLTGRSLSTVLGEGGGLARWGWFRR